MRYRFFLLASASLALVVVGGLWITRPVDPINQANFDRIEVGMTEQLVDQILGGSASEGQTDGCFVDKFWVGSGRNEISVRFELRQDGHFVASKRFFNPGLWDFVKEWWGGYRLMPGGGRAIRLDVAT